MIKFIAETKRIIKLVQDAVHEQQDKSENFAVTFKYSVIDYKEIKSLLMTIASIVNHDANLPLTQ